MSYPPRKRRIVCCLACFLSGTLFANIIKIKSANATAASRQWRSLISVLEKPLISATEMISHRLSIVQAAYSMRHWLKELGWW
jgi:hypothetical protein